MSSGSSRGWTAIPARRSKYSDAMTRARLIIGFLVICAGLGVLSIFAWISSRGTETTDTYEEPKGSAVAYAVAEGFLNGQAPKVPAAIADVDTFQFPSGRLADAGPWPHKVVRRQVWVPAWQNWGEMEEHVFLWTDAEGVWTLRVPILIQADGTPTAAATPMVEPLELSESGIVIPTPGEEVGAAPAVVEKVQRWAEAYYTDQRVALADIAGNPQGTYQGLSGWTVNRVDIVRYYTSQIPGTTHIAYVRVEASKDDVTMTQLHELGVNEAAQVPTIISWGPLGGVR